MVFYKILYRGSIEQKLSVLSDVDRRFVEGNNLIEVHLDGEKVLIRTRAEFELYKQIGFYAYKELVEKEN